MAGNKRKLGGHWPSSALAKPPLRGTSWVATHPEESFPISSDHGGNAAAHRSRMEKGFPAHPASSLPSERLPSDLHLIRAANTQPTHIPQHEGQAGPLTSREEGLKWGKNGKNSIFLPAPHNTLTEGGQQKQSHSALSLDLMSSPWKLANTATARSGKRKIQPEGPTCPLPHTALASHEAQLAVPKNTPAG